MAVGGEPSQTELMLDVISLTDDEGANKSGGGDEQHYLNDRKRYTAVDYHEAMELKPMLRACTPPIGVDERERRDDRSQRHLAAATKRGDSKNMKELRVELVDGSKEVKTVTAIVHGANANNAKPEKSPTGSATSSNSSYSSSQGDADGYLVPVVPKNAAASATVPSRRIGNSLKSTTGSTTSETSSGFHSDYVNDDFAPPEYGNAITAMEMV